jgi:hypothetical protein
MHGYAQEIKDTTYWKRGGLASISFSQVSFNNWVAGGKNSVSGVGIFNYFATYEKDKANWENALKTGYGLLKEGKNELVKSEDRLELNSKFGIKSRNTKILYSTFANFLTQFADGYKYPDKSKKISGLFAPAYLSVASGMDYKPNDKFSLFFSPVSGKFTFVTDEALSAAGAFGVAEGKKSRAEFGATAKGELKALLGKNISMVSSLTLFSNYFHNPEKIDVNWDLLINLKVNEYISANFISNMIWDDDILITIDDKGTMDKRVQWKQLFGFGLSYKF